MRGVEGLVMERGPATFEAFWGEYRTLHRSRANRAFHAVGTAAAIGLLGYAVVRRKWKLLPLVPVVGYGPAWLGHFLFEGNRPATFGNPLWSLRADVRMLREMAAGTEVVNRQDAKSAKRKHQGWNDWIDRGVEVNTLARAAGFIALGAGLGLALASWRSWRLDGSMGEVGDAMPREAGLDSTLALLADPYHFAEKRRARHGSDAFRGRMLLREAVFIGGEEAARLFYDTKLFERAGAMPEPIVSTLLGPDGVQTLDDERHRRRKAMLLSLLTGESVGRLAGMVEAVWLERARRWEATGERVVLYDAMREVLTRAVCAWAGVPVAEEEVALRTRELSALFDQAANVWGGHLYARVQRMRADAWIAGLVDRVRDGTLAVSEGSVLGVVARFRDVDGALLDRRTAAVEVLNVLRPTVAVAVYVVFVAHALHRRPEMVARIQDEPGFAERFVQEVRRCYPFFPAVAARARRDFEWRGYRFTKGTRVVLDLYGTNHDPRSWAEPERFDPDRFRGKEDVRGDGVKGGCPFALVPQGGGEHAAGHRCAGEWVTLGLMLMAVRFLATRIAYRVPEQDLRVDDRRMPALPGSGFVMEGVRVVERSEAVGGKRCVDL